MTASTNTYFHRDYILPSNNSSRSVDDQTRQTQSPDEPCPRIVQQITDHHDITEKTVESTTTIRQQDFRQMLKHISDTGLKFQSVPSPARSVISSQGHRLSVTLTQND